MSYETRDGDLRSSNSGQISFKDKIYDGVQTPNGYLKSGLGLLTDGELGDDSFRHERYGVKGYEWFGWRNDSTSIEDDENINEPNRILFKFDNIRNFSLCTLYVNNAPTQRIELYRLIRFKFSLNGVDFESNVVESTLNRDLNMNMARPILVPLKYISAKFVMIEIYFHSKWLLISEITFDSELVDDGGDLEEDDEIRIILYKNEAKSTTTAASVTISKDGGGGVISGGSTQTMNNNNLTLQTLIMILITLLAFLIFIFIFIIYCFIKKRRNLKKKYQNEQQEENGVKKRRNKK